MTGGAHLSARHREGRRQCEVRHFPVREAAIRQGATDAQSAGPTERPRPSGERGGGRPVEKKKKWAMAGLKGRMGRLATGPMGPKVRKSSFLNNNLIFEYTKALEICRRRFSRNFDMRIFSKIF
jgi:hypothetical protein